MPYPPVGESPALELLASKCQVLAGRFLEAPASELLASIGRMAADLPVDTLGIPERAMAAMLLLGALSRWANHAEVVDDGRVARGFVNLGTTTLVSDAWRRAWATLLDACRAALDSRLSSPGEPIGNAPAALVVQAIAERFRDCRLTLGHVARSLNMSSSHAAHLLRRHTGQTFGWHLRRHRILAAQALLEQTTLRVKQIAADVGYSRSRNLTRDLKRLCGLTPATLRARRRRSHD